MTCTANAPTAGREDRDGLGVARSVEPGPPRRGDEDAQAGPRLGSAALRAWTAPSRGALVGPRGAGVHVARAWHAFTGVIGSLLTAGELATHAKRAAPIYQITDRLLGGRSVHVPADGIVATVAAWLAELGAASPLVEDLADAARAGDWPTIHILSEVLSVDMAVAA